MEAVDDIVRQTGFEEVGFLSLSSSDHSAVGELVNEVMQRHGDSKVSIGLPSLRIETFSVELMENLEKGRRRSGFTFAPEAATDRLRDVINKPIATNALLDVAREVYRRGWTTIKLYFMIGHPTQTLDDVEAIGDLVHEVRKIGFSELGKKSKVRVGVSTLVPKPHTPFQWLPVADEAALQDHIRLLERRLRGPGIEFSWNNPHETMLEAALSRGDRRLADVIQRAWELGAGFDGWGDQFKADAWADAFAQTNLDPDWYARRERAADDILPWDHIDVGVTKHFMRREYERAFSGEPLDDCRRYPEDSEHVQRGSVQGDGKCYACGILALFRDERRETPGDAWGCHPLKPSRKPVELVVDVPIPEQA